MALIASGVTSAMVQYGETPRGRKRPVEDKDQAPGEGHATKVSGGYLSPDRFRFRVSPVDDPDRGVDLIMERHGLVSWRLEAIDLPK